MQLLQHPPLLPTASAKQSVVPPRAEGLGGMPQAGDAHPGAAQSARQDTADPRRPVAEPQPDQRRHQHYCTGRWGVWFCSVVGTYVSSWNLEATWVEIPQILIDQFLNPISPAMTSALSYVPTYCTGRWWVLWFGTIEGHSVAIRGGRQDPVAPHRCIGMKMSISIRVPDLGRYF